MHPRDYQPRERVPGTVYRVVRLIGAGGMGTVYEVEDTTIGKSYVLKTLHPQLGTRDDLARRMQDEARTLARLNHPNIVEVITAGITADDLRLPYYVMERLNGQSLRTILSKKGRLDLSHVYKIGIDLLDALDHAHDKGVIHRDVKPDNIFLHRTAGGVTVTKLLDFGIVSMLDGGRNETAGRFLGTLRYAAPEQLRGDKPTPRTDVYAAALVIYEMVAGRGPFDAEGDSQKIGSAHLHKAPPSLSKHATVPKQLDTLLMAALSKSADSRPRDAFSFAASLRNLERLESPSLRAPTPGAAIRPAPPRPAAVDSSRPPPPRPSATDSNRAPPPRAPPGIPRPEVRSASVTVPLSVASPATVASPPPNLFAPPAMAPVSAMSPLGAIPSTGVSSLLTPTPPTSFPRTTLRGMTPPTFAPTGAPWISDTAATAVEEVDRSAPTHSLVLEGPRLFRPRAEAGGRVSTQFPTFAPSTSVPGGDTLADVELPAATPESSPMKSVAPHIRSLAAEPPPRVPRGAIAASVVGLAGLTVLAIVALSVRPTASAMSITPTTGLASPGRDGTPEPSPVVAFPAPTLQPDMLDGLPSSQAVHLPPPAEPPPVAVSVHVQPAPTSLATKGSGGDAKTRSRPTSSAPAPVNSPASRAPAGARATSGSGSTPATRERPGPGF